MSDVVPSIPSVTPQNLVDVARKLKHLIDVREGRVGDPLDANVTYRDLVAAGIAQMPSGGAARGAVPIIAANPIEQGYDPSTDMSIPPQPTGLTAAAGLTSIQLKWNAPTYENHAYTEVWSLGADEIGNAQLIGTTTARIYVDTIGTTGTQRFYWVRHVSQAAVTGAFNATAGVSATTGKIGNTDLGPLIIEAGNLADGSVQAGKLAANSIAVGTAAIQDGAIINAMIADATIDSAKIANLDAGKITSGFIEAGRIEAGSLDAKIASLDAAVIKSGVIDVARIGDGTITNAKIGQVIQSTTFNEGVSGWIIDKSSGIRVFASSGQRVLDLAASGTNPIIKVGSVLSVLGDGTASFGGTLNAATGNFKGAINVGSYTGYSWPASGGTGAHLSSSGLMIGNLNDNRYFQVTGAGNVYAPGFSVVNGALTISQANVINTLNIAGNAVIVPVAKEIVWGGLAITNDGSQFIATDPADFGGGRVVVHIELSGAHFYAGEYDPNQRVRIYRNGAVLREIGVGVGLAPDFLNTRGKTIHVTIVDFPPSGQTHTYGAGIYDVSYPTASGTIYRAIVTADSYKR